MLTLSCSCSPAPAVVAVAARHLFRAMCRPKATYSHVSSWLLDFCRFWTAANTLQPRVDSLRATVRTLLDIEKLSPRYFLAGSASGPPVNA